MTYFGFLLRFLVMPILILLAINLLNNRRNRSMTGFRHGAAVWAGIALHIVVAVAYTTPWDNYLVATGVWYYNPDLVTGIVLGYVPIEEYTFFVLETLMGGLLWWVLARRLGPVQKVFRPNRAAVYASAAGLASLWLASGVLLFFGSAAWTYLSLILFWALPPILLQVLFGADILWHFRRLVFWSIFLPGAYLSLMDIAALQETTWSISPAQTTGILFFGILPLEEVVFFFITNVLITFGMTLLLANVSQARFIEIRDRLQAWKEARKVHPQAR